NRPFEQDAMESEGSGQLSMVSADPTGAFTQPVGQAAGPAPTPAVGEPVVSHSVEPGPATVTGSPASGESANGADFGRGHDAISVSETAAAVAGSEDTVSRSEDRGEDTAVIGRDADSNDPADGADQDGDSGSARRGDPASRRDGQRNDRRGRGGNGRREDQGRTADGADQARDSARGDQQQGYRDGSGRDNGGRDGASRESGSRESGGRGGGGRGKGRDNSGRGNRGPGNAGGGGGGRGWGHPRDGPRGPDRPDRGPGPGPHPTP